jgi:thiamine-monophosphate kinase
MKEFDRIADYFAPLSEGFDGAFGLTDDAAAFTPPTGHELVITKDAISEGVHFLGSESADLIAKKLLRTNLSDLAAMGAEPLCYFLSIMTPKDTPEAWFRQFAQGLKEDQEHYHLYLAGGDSIHTLGPFSASLTALGIAPTGKILRRNGARLNDKIYVSGTLGDSALALANIKGSLLHLDSADVLLLKERYFLPQPRMQLAHALRGRAHACIDISDGLVQDLGHICKASGVGALIHRHKLPISQAAYHAIEQDDIWWEKIYTGGDDYELLFTLSHADAEEMEALAKQLHLPLTCIGDIVKGKAVELHDEHGFDITPKLGGFRH